MEPQLVLLENQNSKIIKSLSSIPYTKRHVQQISENYPNNFKSVITVQANNHNITVPVAKQKYSFSIPDSGFLRDLIIKTTLESSSSTAILNNSQIARLGIMLYDLIELKQNNNIIFSNTPSYILQRISDSSIEEHQNYIRISEANNWESASPVTVYTKLFSWIFDSPDNNILLDFNKDLELVLTVANITYTAAVTSYKPELVIFRTFYEAPFVSSYIRENFYDNVTNYLVYDIRPLVVPLEIDATSSSVFIQYPHLVSCIHTSIIKNDNIFTSVNITGMKMKIGQTTIFECDKITNILNTEQHAADNGSNEMSYYFGNKKRTYHSGALDISSKQFELIITYDAIATTTANLYINFEYLSIFQCHKDNGKFSSNFIH